MTKVGERVKADCPNCGRSRWADVMAIYEHHQNADDDGAVWTNTSHRILKCPACEHVVHQTDFVFSEDTIHYRGPDGELEEDLSHTIEQWPLVPLEARPEPEWLDSILVVDETLHNLIRQVYRALTVDLNVFAITGVRTTFDKATEILGIDPATTFTEKLAELEKRGYVGPTERDHIQAVVEAGNAAAHRGWTPSREELRIALDIVEGFLYRTFVLRQGADKLKAAIPARPKRKKITS